MLQIKKNIYIYFVKFSSLIFTFWPLDSHLLTLRPRKETPPMATTMVICALELILPFYSSSFPSSSNYWRIVDFCIKIKHISVFRNSLLYSDPRLVCQCAKQPHRRRNDLQGWKADCTHSRPLLHLCSILLSPHRTNLPSCQQQYHHHVTATCTLPFRVTWCFVCGRSVPT